MKTVELLGLLIMVAAIYQTTLAFAEPLELVASSVSNYDGSSATVTMTWNHTDMVSSCKVGCVSCEPNTSESTTDYGIMLHKVTPFPNSHMAMLYIIAYDSDNNIITAKQLIINLNSIADP